LLQAFGAKQLLGKAEPDLEAEPGGGPAEGIGNLRFVYGSLEVRLDV